MNRGMDAWPEINHREEAMVVKFIAEVQGQTQQSCDVMHSNHEAQNLIRP